MTMFEILNANDDLLALDDGHKVRGEWTHNAWPYRIHALKSDTNFHGTYRAGTSVKHADADELRQSIRRVIAGDLADATDIFSARPTMRDLIAQAQYDYGSEDPLAAYDGAVEAHRLCEWFWNLTTAEQAEIENYLDWEIER